MGLAMASSGIVARKIGRLGMKQCWAILKIQESIRDLVARLVGLSIVAWRETCTCGFGDQPRFTVHDAYADSEF